jgi:agmatinase
MLCPANLCENDAGRGGMMSWNYNVFIGCESSYEEAKMVLFGAPFDGTTSFRPGTRFAGKAIRDNSIAIETYSPLQDKDICDLKVYDEGDLEFGFGNTLKTLEEIEGYARRVLNDHKIPLMIGGEHLTTLGAVKAAVKKYPDLNVVHFDAHADLRDDYLGEKLSHATVMRRIWDLTGDERIFQFGIRSGSREEIEWGREHVNTCMNGFATLDRALNILKDRPVYFTLDLDILDPSAFPGTGTPEAGGVTYNELINAAVKVSELNIVGLDINELSPVYDLSGSSTLTACKVLRELILAVYK